MAVFGNCGETGLKLAGFVKWLRLNKISNEHKNSVSEMAVGKIKSRQDSVFKLVNLPLNPQDFIPTSSVSGWLALGLDRHVTTEVRTGF